MAEDKHAGHKAILWGTGLSTALGLSPYILPKLGIGNAGITDEVIGICRDTGAQGSGLSGLINKGLGHIPGIGDTLAAGGLTSALISGGIGVGGTLLGNYISKHYDREGHIPWGKIIKYAAITTSILIALPSLLSGISMGITYLAMHFGSTGFASSVIDTMTKTLGFMGSTAMKATGSGISGFISQAICCGVAAFPAVGSLFVPNGSSATTHHSTTTQTWANKVSTASAIPAEMIR